MKHYHYPVATSTNELVKELIGKNEFVVITADAQTEGHGRSGKIWVGNPGENLYCSIGVMHKQNPDAKRLTLFQVSGCFAVKATLHKVAPEVEFFIKYPNDIVVKTLDAKKKTEIRKISGVLVEHSFWGNNCLCSVIGFGVNCLQIDFPKNIENNAISLANFGVNITPAGILPLLISNFEKFNAIDKDEMFEIWKKELNIIGKKIAIVGEDEPYGLFRKPNLWKVRQILNDGRLEAFSTITGERRLIDNGDSIRYELG
jgi:biotin-[acetyl-CoA-carboxylase] ligase BirA-like protein